MSCTMYCLVIGLVMVPCQLASVVLGYRIGAGEWPWKRETT